LLFHKNNIVSKLLLNELRYWLFCKAGHFNLECPIALLKAWITISENKLYLSRLHRKWATGLSPTLLVAIFSAGVALGAN